MTIRRNVIVHIATSADGYIARADGDLEWLTRRPAPEGFHGMNALMKSIDAKLLGRKTYDESLRLGAKFDSKSRNIVFSRHAPPADAPSGVEFVISVVPIFIGDGVPLIARRHRDVPLELRSTERFEDGLVQLHDRVSYQS